MYCPNCGSNNEADLRFCTRCGTNIGAVADTLTGRAGSGAQPDDRRIKVIKEYYKGRRDTITGLVLIPATVKLIAILIMLGLPPIASFFIVSWMVFWGIAALAGGLGKWIAAAGEMRALGHQVPKSRLLLQAAKLFGRSGLSTGDNYSTGPVSAPISVPMSITEPTTRNLEEGIRPTKQSQ